jgi:hypothetical protein
MPKVDFAVSMYSQQMYKTESLIKDVTTRLAEAQQAVLTSQLSDLLRAGVLEIRHTEPVLVSVDNGLGVEIRQGVSLTFKGADRLAELELENAELKARLDGVKDILKGNSRD